MAIGVLNPFGITVAARPTATLTAAAERRWFSDAGVGTRVYAQDLNALLGQFRAALDHYSVADVEGDDGSLWKTIDAAVLAAIGDPAFVTNTNAALALRLRFDAAQTLTAGQKTQAQTNMGLAALALLSVIDTAQIVDSAVTNAKLAQIATARFKGRVSASTGPVEDLTAAQVKTALAIATTDVSGLNVGSQIITGNVTVDRIGAATAAQLILRGDAGTYKAVYSQTGSTNRWLFGSNSVAEAGASAGSDFEVRAYDDAGTLIGPALTINRAARDVNITAGSLQLANTIVVDSNRILRARPYTIATLPAANVAGGQIIYCSDLGGGGGQLVSDGSFWRRSSPGQATNNTTVGITWTTLTDAEEVKLTGTLTADRIIALSNTRAYAGSRVRLKRTGGGAFNWNVTHADGTANIGLSGSAVFVHDGAAWYLAT